MQDDATKRRPKQIPQAVLLGAPFCLVILTVIGMRFLHRDQSTPNHHRVALHRVRTEHDRVNSHGAKKAATAFAHKHLLPDGSEIAPGLTVIPRRRGQYRVRGSVTYPDAENKRVLRSFEVDLLHGPTDDTWRLIDTEFLP